MKYLICSHCSLFQGVLNYLDQNGNYTVKSQHNVSFEEFIRYVIHTLEMGSPDPHWTSFSATCLPCLVYYDFIGKLETSRTDFSYVMKNFANATSFSNNLQGPSSHNMNKTTDDTFREFYKQIPSELLRRLVDLYRTDFVLFGYDIKRPLYT